jgi:catechol 2,3-dioxygenase-like lactoylglutathione lyase family enzyme
MTKLSEAPLIAFLATADTDECKEFYIDKLGFKLLGETTLALEFESGGTMLRIQKVDDFEPQGFTALGWRVTDIQKYVAALTAKGVRFKRYDDFGQDDAGVWTSPTGTKVAWFEDPDGNLLSLAEIA